jgi:hypothetical protein
MKALQSIAFSPSTCAAELDAFDALLGSSDELSERNDILPFFRAHQHLAAFLGMLNPDVDVFDAIAYEYDLFGDFACDLVVGDSQRRAFTLVELEDATAESIFQKVARKHTPEWARRFDHGYSQLIDWFWKLDVHRQNDDFRDRFGGSDASFFGMLVVGRSKFMGDRERRRLKWRLDRVVIDSHKVSCLTYDDLSRVLRGKLEGLVQLASGAE